MTNFQNFISNVDSTANVLFVLVDDLGYMDVHTTTANNVSINGDRVMLYDHKIKRYIHTQIKDIKSFEIA